MYKHKQHLTAPNPSPDPGPNPTNTCTNTWTRSANSNTDTDTDPNPTVHSQVLGVRLNQDTTFKDFTSKSRVFRSEIGFRLNINNQIDINQFFINSLHVWRWWQIISWGSYFRMCLFIVIYLIVTFQISKSNLCKITINSFAVCVPFPHSPFSRESVYQHRKHVCGSFIQVPSKGFESYSLADSQEWLLCNTGVISDRV